MENSENGDYEEYGKDEVVVIKIVAQLTPQEEREREKTTEMEAARSKRQTSGKQTSKLLQIIHAYHAKEEK